MYKVKLHPLPLGRARRLDFQISVLSDAGHVMQVLERGGLTFGGPATRRDAYQYALDVTKREAAKWGVDVIETVWPNRAMERQFS